MNFPAVIIFLLAILTTSAVQSAPKNRGTTLQIALSTQSYRPRPDVTTLEPAIVTKVSIATEAERIRVNNWIPRDKHRHDSDDESVSGTSTQNTRIKNETILVKYPDVKCVIPVPCPEIRCRERFTLISDPSGCTCPKCVCTLPCPACPTGYVPVTRDPSVCQCPLCIPSCNLKNVH